MRRAIQFLLCLPCLAVAATAAADEVQQEFFEKKIRPALVKYCYECHSSDARKLGGELSLDNRVGLMKGGESGAVLKAGRADESLLIKAIRYTDDAVKMPPKGKIPDQIIADFEKWVNDGAYDPRVEQAATKVTKPWPDIMRERSDWWSLKPLTTTSPESGTANRSDHPVDRFINDKLAQQLLNPANPATPRTLARRLSLVLTGLPPTTQQVDQFMHECRQESKADKVSQNAPARYVDSLLDSPHFGEHWARHWLDVVRFSETHGNEWNYEVHHAWRYRDYLIRAYNEDVPYDQFVREHIAGDLLPTPRWNRQEQFNESVIGTGFYRFGEVNHDDCITLRAIGYDLADNQIDTLTKAFQATTVACARCHNHKLDAISTEDYYALLAVLRSSRNVSHSVDAPTVNQSARQRMKEIKVELRKELAALWTSDLQQVERYMAAAEAQRSKQANAAELANGLNPQRLEKWVAALAAEKQPFEDPLDLWRRLVNVNVPAAADAVADALQPSISLAAIWKEWNDQFVKESQERNEFNQKEFVTYADFRAAHIDGWSLGGQSMNEPVSTNGEFVLNPEGDSILQAILPAGRYTHALSSKLNGTLRSPVIPTGKKQISFQVMGQRSSAVRLVSNNCQLNYANYRALTSPDFQWITFSPPEDRDVLRTYAELMTMFDNPKFPDQLSALGGDKDNYKMPWDKAAENPRSYFGVTRVVLHDVAQPPKPTLTHLALLADVSHSQASKSDQSTGFDRHQLMRNVRQRYVDQIAFVINAWSNQTTTEDDVLWLNQLVRRDLLSHQRADSSRIDQLTQEYRKLESGLSLPRVVAGVGDGGPGIEQPVLLRGDYNRPGESVPRRYLEVLSLLQKPEFIQVSLKPGTQSFAVKPFTSTGSGRMELAEQIVSTRNPLTARVMANRVWHHLFGTGLVRTVDDFGHVGETPSHPELLDYLAGQFISEGYSVKKLIRQVVMTHTFQQSNHPSDRSNDVDPQNRLLQHFPARRMEAESVRDSILFASGRLDRTFFGPSIQPYREKEYADRRLFPGPLDGNGRRSVYIKNNLMESPKFLAAFNLPGGKVTQGRRDVTNVPAQALALLNDPFVLEQAEFWSKGLINQNDQTVTTRVDRMFQTALNRPPTATETDRFERMIAKLAELYEIPMDQILTNQVLWKDVAHAVFNLNEMIYIP